MPAELRCPTRLHARINDDGLIEMKCRNNAEPCGAGKGMTVLHYFDPISGDLVKTRKFREPQDLFTKKKEKV